MSHETQAKSRTLDHSDHSCFHHVFKSWNWAAECALQKPQKGVVLSQNVLHARLRLTESSSRKSASSFISACTLQTCWGYQRYPVLSIKYHIRADEVSNFAHFPCCELTAPVCSWKQLSTCCQALPRPSLPLASGWWVGGRRHPLRLVSLKETILKSTLEVQERSKSQQEIDGECWKEVQQWQRKGYWTKHSLPFSRSLAVSLSHTETVKICGSDAIWNSFIMSFSCSWRQTNVFTWNQQHEFNSNLAPSSLHTLLQSTNVPPLTASSHSFTVPWEVLHEAIDHAELLVLI